MSNEGLIVARGALTRRRLLAAGTAAGLGAWASLGARGARAQTRLPDITSGNVQPISIALPDFAAAQPADAEMARNMSQVIAGDLKRSGLFAPIDPAAFIEKTPNFDAPRLPDWKAINAQALTTGRLTRQADGRVQAAFRLWDVFAGTALDGKQYVTSTDNWRRIAHIIADAIYERLTGERGVFATRIAYVTKSGNRFALNVTDADGQGGQVALASTDPIISPAWSPSGKELAYVSFESQKATVWLQDVASGQRRMIANFRGSNSAPAFAPDGRSLALTLSRDGIAQLYLMPREGGTPRRLATSNAIDTEPVFTPDGRTLYFVSDRGGGPQIYRMPAAGGAAERVTFSGAYNISPAISPDGKWLAFITRQGNAYRLMVQDLSAGGGASAITDTQDDESPSFAPNGRLIVYASRSQGRDLLMTTTLDGRIKTRLLTTGADMREPAWGPFGR